MTPPPSPFEIIFFEMFQIQIPISIKIKISIVNSWGMLLLEGRLERQERRVVSAILGKSGWATLTFFLTQPLFSSPFPLNFVQLAILGSCNFGCTPFMELFIRGIISKLKPTSQKWVNNSVPWNTSLMSLMARTTRNPYKIGGNMFSFNNVK